MPIFEFICGKCGKKFEEIVSRNEPAPTCPHCGAADAKKIMSACCRHRSGDSGDYSMPASSGGGGCAGCSGGNCASCGH